MRKLFVLLLGLFLFVNCFSQINELSNDSIIAKIERENYQGAIDACNKGIAIYPSFSQGYLLRGFKT